MNGQANAQQTYHRGMYEGPPGNYNVAQEFGGIPVDPQLPPIRRINNHLPPKEFRVAPPTLMGVKQTSYNIGLTKNVMQSRQSDAESVMNFSQSESESEDDVSYSDDESADQTTYTYADDEPPTTNFNCMNSLFLPTANDREGHDDAAIIRCHRVGPSSAELQLNIPLPSRYMKHLDKEGGKSGYMDNVCRGSGLSYNSSQYDSSLFDESVVEVDPYKQFRERMAPQFYESLIEELSDEDADSDDDEDVTLRQRDDSQIFGYFDAHRNAVQQAIYNEIVLQQGYIMPPELQSPPSHIFVTGSSSSSPTLMTPEGETSAALNLVDWSIDGSSDVFSRPEDCQDSLLNRHLRESVEVGNTIVSQLIVHTKSNHAVDNDLVSSGTQSHIDSGAQSDWVVASAPSVDESSTHHSDKMFSMIHDEQIKNLDMDNQSQASGSSISSDDKYAALEQTKEDVVDEEIPHDVARSCDDVPETKSQASEQRFLSEKPMECPPLVVLPTFDEPGQIIMKELSQEDISAIPEEPQVDDEAVPFDGDYEEDEKSMNEETWGNTDAPDDERICVLTYSERVGPSSTLLESLTINENDAPADENIEFPSRCWDMSPKNKSEWCPLDETEYSDASVSSSNKSEACPIDETESSDASVGSQDATVVVRNEDAKKPDAPETEPGILSPRRVMITQTLEENRDYKLKSPKNHDDIPMKSSIVRRFVNRPILEETSKANVRTEIYESNTTSEISEKDSRELRKDRIRALDAIRPTPTADIPLPVVTLEDDPTIEDITNNPSETLKEQETLEDEERDDVDEVHGLDELMEFHSCDEDFFTSHTDSEFISAGFA